MRIIGEIPHPVYKITLFYHNDRYSVQVEHGVYSQSFRIRTRTGMESSADAFRLVDPEFLQGLAHIFEQMHDLWLANLNRHESSMNTDEFERIL